MNNLKSLSWDLFEKVVADSYRRLGYQVVENGLGGPDGGVDLVLSRGRFTTLVQCKLWNKGNVDVKVVREMCGLMMHYHADEVKIICANAFTKDAKAFAVGKPIELVGGQALLTLIGDIKQNSDDVTAPLCPICKAPMALRKNKNTRKSFYGCSHYPACHGARTLPSSLFTKL